ncbi:M28 family peptidase [Flavilitoribacter nigricans]|uniref:Glutamate carboxypeptidase n=1 Tax=Flavilitoribacter nigricans (strain ATCC 23147 / DSM 23189 / NBRC 102662 / NCIMB 1420 / SS-2) TaxID=1122177 RepID=A0A2D0N270_FLAN2|nr:M28 family peptidase [Flavilitoribacter nigricans]PHN02642.1 glutamate carboxypeptidase [Flavilitoribacter nigricans DSM 23189 = NBRC 102662]
MKKTILPVFLLLVGMQLQAQLSGFFPDGQDEQQTIEQLFLELPKSERFKEHLRELTKVPHRAGTPENKAVADYMQKVMADAGLQSEQFPYDIYLPTGPGEIEIELVTPIRMPLNNQEYILEADPFSQQDVGPGWNSYSGSGDVTAEVVYANYGTKEDFERLADLGVSVKGKIVMARYGGNFRGYKAKFAEAAGAAGLIIYTDPEDSGYMRGLGYPDGTYFSESTIQRGSVLTLDYSGDPLTPFEPALPMDGPTKVERLDPADVPFHTIPVTPLPYGSAKEILSRMQGDVVPGAWQGGLPFTYRLTGGPELKVRLNVQQEKDFVRVQNVVGTLEGSTYPDEWIIMGSHYDAWVHGASDPNSGTAMLLCLAEALGELAKQGYQPKRTIKIAHWDAEEHGIIASTEWVEQFKDELDAKAIAYFNADGACSGLSFGASSAPSLKGLLVESTKVVPYTDQDISVYEHWTARLEDKSQGPRIGNLGGGSDHLGFYAHLGIPSMGAGMRGPTLYHSAYDDFHWYATYADPEFQSGPTVAKVFGIMGLRLANADILPLDVGRYGSDLRTHIRTAEKAIQAYAPDYKTTKLLASVDQLAKATEKYVEVMEASAAKGKLKNKKLEQVNNTLLKLDRAFIDDEGMAYGKWFRSLYASSDPYSGYASWMLPGLLYEASIESTSNLPSLEKRYIAAFDRLRADIESLIKMLD